MKSKGGVIWLTGAGEQVEGIRSLSEIKLSSKVKKRKKNKEGDEESCSSRWKFRLVKLSG
jgi:hypothetical protein